MQVAEEQVGDLERKLCPTEAATEKTASEASRENRVSWEFHSGASGFVDCSSPEAARLIVADLRPDSRVWVGGKLVQHGWLEA